MYGLLKHIHIPSNFQRLLGPLLKSLFCLILIFNCVTGSMKSYWVICEENQANVHRLSIDCQQGSCVWNLIAPMCLPYQLSTTLGNEYWEKYGKISAKFMCLSSKFPHQEIRWNYGIFRCGIYKYRWRTYISSKFTVRVPGRLLKLTMDLYC